MSESGRGRGRPIDRTAERRSANRLRVAVLAVCGGWLLLALVAMLISTSPDFGPISGTAQHLLLGTVLSVMIAAAVASTSDRSGSVVAWNAVVATSVALFGYELLQLAVPVRAFQWGDLINGVTGATIGGLVALTGFRFRDRFVAGVVGFGGVALVIGIVALILLPDDELRPPIDARLDDCMRTTSAPPADWTNQVLSLRTADAGCVVAGPVVFVPFGADLVDEGAGVTPGVRLAGGGLASGPLVGLPDALAARDAISFGIRFNSAVTNEDPTPVVLARLGVAVDPVRPIITVLQRGPHLTVNVGSGRPVVGISIPLAERLTPGTVQELVLTYQAGVAMVYLDGALVGQSTIAPFTFTIDAELVLEVGWRADQRWTPLTGTVSELLIADRVLDPAEVKDVFAG